MSRLDSSIRNILGADIKLTRNWGKKGRGLGPLKVNSQQFNDTVTQITKVALGNRKLSSDDLVAIEKELLSEAKKYTKGKIDPADQAIQQIRSTHLLKSNPVEYYTEQLQKHFEDMDDKSMDQLLKGDKRLQPAVFSGASIVEKDSEWTVAVLRDWDAEPVKFALKVSPLGYNLSASDGRSLGPFMSCAEVKEVICKEASQVRSETFKRLASQTWPKHVSLAPIPGTDRFILTEDTKGTPVELSLRVSRDGEIYVLDSKGELCLAPNADPKLIAEDLVRSQSKDPIQYYEQQLKLENNELKKGVPAKLRGQNSFYVERRKGQEIRSGARYLRMEPQLKKHGVAIRLEKPSKWDSGQPLQMYVCFPWDSCPVEYCEVFIDAAGYLLVAQDGSGDFERFSDIHKLRSVLLKMTNDEVEKPLQNLIEQLKGYKESKVEFNGAERTVKVTPIEGHPYRFTMEIGGTTTRPARTYTVMPSPDKDGFCLLEENDPGEILGRPRKSIGDLARTALTQHLYLTDDERCMPDVEPGIEAVLQRSDADASFAVTYVRSKGSDHADKTDLLASVKAPWMPKVILYGVKASSAGFEVMDRTAPTLDALEQVLEEIVSEKYPPLEAVPNIDALNKDISGDWNFDDGSMSADVAFDLIDEKPYQAHVSVKIGDEEVVLPFYETGSLGGADYRIWPVGPDGLSYFSEPSFKSWGGFVGTVRGHLLARDAVRNLPVYLQKAEPVVDNEEKLRNEEYDVLQQRLDSGEPEETILTDQGYLFATILVPTDRLGTYTLTIQGKHEETGEVRDPVSRDVTLVSMIQENGLICTPQIHYMAHENRPWASKKAGSVSDVIHQLQMDFCSHSFSSSQSSVQPLFANSQNMIVREWPDLGLTEGEYYEGTKEEFLLEEPGTTGLFPPDDEHPDFFRLLLVVQEQKDASHSRLKTVDEYILSPVENDQGERYLVLGAKRGDIRFDNIAAAAKHIMKGKGLKKLEDNES